MIKPPTVCTHTCKEYCTALELAALREKEAILEYGALRDGVCRFGATALDAL